MSQYALVSVSDKEGIERVAQALVSKGVTILSTGGTYNRLKTAGFPVQEVENYTGDLEMLDGRVKTLHPKIHGGLLGLRDNPEHVAAMESQGIQPIDYVIVNLYPFKETILKENVTLAEAIENIDIGGPSMLRSAAKNYQSVTVVTDPNDYPALIEQLETDGQTTDQFRLYCAKKAFQLTSHYDTLISQYLNQQPLESEDFETHKWNHLTLTYSDEQTLRYGENSHQTASFYREVLPPSFSIASAEQLHGKELSYNNIKDADAAMKIVREFAEPAAVAVKHMNPCGVAIGTSIEQAFERCYQADSKSIFGGIVAVNRPVTAELAEKLSEIFLEIIIAPNFDEAALDILMKKKNIRLLRVDFSHVADSFQDEYVSVGGGLLKQSSDQASELSQATPVAVPDNWTLASEREPSQKELRALNFGMKVVKHVKSNAIVVTNDYMTLGIGAGQMNRVGAAVIALDQAEEQAEELRETYIMASDAFLPMPDTAELAAERGIQAIAQPGGSKRDQDTVDVVDANDMAMVMTNLRHFRH